MQSPPPEKYTYPKVVPESTNDVNLKRARVVDSSGKSYIRVTGTVTSDDLDPIKEALGDPTDTSSENTVIGLLKKIDVKQFGVGQAYPGSTGGEIFNYYGTDSNKNIASGMYSTARGLKNTASGSFSFASGQVNTASGSTAIAMGNNNEATTANAVAIGTGGHATGNSSITIGTSNTSSGSSSVTLGVGNSVSALNCVGVGQSNMVTTPNCNTFGQNNIISSASSTAIGTQNTIRNDAIFGFVLGTNNTIDKSAIIVGDTNTVSTKSGNMLVGKNLHDDTASNVVILGQYNKTPVLSNPKTIIASGSGSSNKANALECTKDTTKICNNLQLATNSYEVNDITAPLSSPASTADKTLATKAYVDSKGSFTPQKEEIYATYAYTTFLPPVDLGTPPFPSGRVVLRGTITMQNYSFGTPMEATFEAHYDLTASPVQIDSLVQQTVYYYDTNKFVAVTLAIQFAIDGNQHIIMQLAPSSDSSGTVFYDSNRVAQGHDYMNSFDITFDTMSSHSYFYNY